MPSVVHPPGQDGRSARWAGQRDRRRREFVAAALRAIATHGPEVSTEQIAAEAGVARTQVYKHFDDAADLRRAIAARASELLGASLDFWNLRGTPREMVREAVEAHMAWLAEHRHLYVFLSRHSMLEGGENRAPIVDVRTAIAGQLSELLRLYLIGVGADPRHAEPVAFAVVGMVDSATARWLEHPQDLPRQDLAFMLARWVWQVFSEGLRLIGTHIDPDEPLLLPIPPPL